MAEIPIRRLDPTDDADMDAFQEVYAAAELAEDPDAGLYSRADGIMILSSAGGEFGEGYGAFDGDRMVGELLVTGSLVDNLRSVRVWIWVTPSHQRRGIGTRLAAYADERMRALGRSIAQAQARIGPGRDNGNLRFAPVPAMRWPTPRSSAGSRSPPTSTLLARLAAEAAPHHPDYRIRAVVGPVPADLADSYVALKNRLAVEMPQGDLETEAGRETAAELAEEDRDLTSAGRTRVAAYALDSSGTVVGYAVCVATNEHHEHVDQWGTLVDPAHRGHRLGMAVKCAQLTTLSEHFPHKRFLETTNAETNTHMVAINEALGFEVAQVYGDFQKRLAQPGDTT